MARAKKPISGETFHPKGTLLIMLLFMLALIILWGSVYLIMISRGATS